MLTTLHSFDFTDGANPYAPLIQASNGRFYGITFDGGVVITNGCPGGCGTVFAVNSTGSEATVHKFDPLYGDGQNSYAH
jgi:hypothetical protein